MSHRVTAAGADGTWTHMADARLLVNTRGVGTPVGLIEHVELNLILIGGGMAGLQESQLVDIAVPYLLGILQHRFRVEAIAARRLRGIGAEPFLPENHEMLALHGTAEAPLAVLAHVVVGGIGAGMPEDASRVGKHQRSLEGGVAEQRLQPVFGIALRERWVEEVHHGGSARAVVHAKRHRVGTLKLVLLVWSEAIVEFHPDGFLCPDAQRRESGEDNSCKESLRLHLTTIFLPLII